METLLSDGRSYLVGDSFSVADAYFFVVANWSGHTGIDLERWPHVAAYQQRIAARETVQAALKAEGLAACGGAAAAHGNAPHPELGRASCRERVCQYV